MGTLQAIRGTRDILPSESPLWATIEDIARQVLSQWAYREIRTPIFEQTELFARGIGEATDAVGKEMYSFEDRGGRSIALQTGDYGWASSRLYSKQTVCAGWCTAALAHGASVSLRKTAGR